VCRLSSVVWTQCDGCYVLTCVVVCVGERDKCGCDRLGCGRKSWFYGCWFLKVCQLYLTHFSNTCNDESNPPGPFV
jgi:hypothetical protein